MNALALRFFPVYLRDLLITRGAAMAGIALVLLLPTLLMDFSRLRPAMSMTEVLAEALGNMVTFLILVAAYGVIGDDVRRGYFRNLFSKPVSPVAYYALAFVGTMAALYATLLVATAVFAVVKEPVWPGRALVRAGFEFVLLGGVIFGLSRLTRLDWLAGVLLYVFGQLMRGVYPPDETFRGAVLNVVLPPSHLLREGLLDADGIVVSGALWIVGYGAVFFTGGLVLVRVLAFGTQRS